MIKEIFEKFRINMLREEHNLPKPTVESLYNRIVNKIDEERQSQNLSWKELSKKSEVPMLSIHYAFIEDYSDFHVRLKLDELLKLCVALDIDISLFPL